jgi:hypothetical protein
MRDALLFLHRFGCMLHYINLDAIPKLTPLWRWDFNVTLCSVSLQSLRFQPSNAYQKNHSFCAYLLKSPTYSPSLSKYAMSHLYQGNTICCRLIGVVETNIWAGRIAKLSVMPCGRICPMYLAERKYLRYP